MSMPPTDTVVADATKTMVSQQTGSAMDVGRVDKPKGIPEAYLGPVGGEW